jgi:phosphatidylserine synthase
LRVIFIGTKQPVRVAASVLALVGFSFLTILAWQIPVACAPIVVYGLVGLRRRDDSQSEPAEEDHTESDKQHAAGLTLAGFCFTSLVLLVSFFNEAIQREDSGPENMILFFCCALFCFVASSLALRHPASNTRGFLSEAFIDNGFWCILVGLLAYFLRLEGMRKPAIAMSVLLVFYAASLILHFRRGAGW